MRMENNRDKYCKTRTHRPNENILPKPTLDHPRPICFNHAATCAINTESPVSINPSGVSMHTTTKILASVFINLTVLLTLHTSAFAGDDGKVVDFYRIQPGDVLVISVWKEEELNQGVIVRPDGQITFPLIGEAKAAGNRIEDLRLLISDRLKKYIPDPVVTVSVQELAGNTIYIIGKVNGPGAFPIARNVDVMQALSMAGGTSTYAALNDIKILRRENGILKALSFKYAEVEKGKRLEQNIVLQAGDVVVVP